MYHGQSEQQIPYHFARVALPLFRSTVARINKLHTPLYGLHWILNLELKLEQCAVKEEGDKTPFVICCQPNHSKHHLKLQGARKKPGKYVTFSFLIAIFLINGCQ